MPRSSALATQQSMSCSNRCRRIGDAPLEGDGPPPSQRREHRVDPREARLGAFLDAVVHPSCLAPRWSRSASSARAPCARRGLRTRASADGSGTSARYARAGRPRGTRPRRRRTRVESPAAPGAHVHLLDGRGVTPPLRDQRGIGPDAETWSRGASNSRSRRIFSSFGASSRSSLADRLLDEVADRLLVGLRQLRQGVRRRPHRAVVEPACPGSRTSSSAP